MSGKLSGKVAIVTGSGQSVGRAVAVMMAREGAKVVVNSRSEVSRDGTPTAADTAQEIREFGGEVLAVYADVSTMAGGRHLISSCLQHFGTIDILVNHAGQGPVYPIATMTEVEWDQTINVNLKSQYICTHLAVPVMQEKAWGRILNFGSRGGFHGVAAMSAYAAAKMGSIGFTFALARELAGSKITVNCIAPRANTLRMAQTRAQMLASTGKAMFADEPELTPEHAAPMTVYLATDAAANISGQVFFTGAGDVVLYDGPRPGKALSKSGIWSLDELAAQVPAAFGDLSAPFLPAALK